MSNNVDYSASPADSGDSNINRGQIQMSSEGRRTEQFNLNATQISNRVGEIVEDDYNPDS